MARPGDPVVGPADDATRRREIEKRLKEEAEFRRTHPIDSNDPDRDHLPQTGANPHRELRRGPGGKSIPEIVDDMS